MITRVQEQTPVISRVRVKNFGSIEDVDVKLGQLTVLVGKNGSGKSTFLEALSFLRDAIKPGVGLEAAIASRNGLSYIRRKVSGVDVHNIEIIVTVEAKDLWAEYGFILNTDGMVSSIRSPKDTRSDTSKVFRIVREFCQLGKNQLDAELEFEIEEGEWKTQPHNPFVMDKTKRADMKLDKNQLFLPVLAVLQPDITNLVHHLTASMFYTLYPDALGGFQADMMAYALLENGNNLASVLRRIEQEMPKRDLVSILTHVIADIAEIKVVPVGSFLLVKVLHRTNAGAVWLDIGQESDGTKRLLFLLVALYQGGLLELLAIEEPEIALHPGALDVLSDVLHEASLIYQILITTQSPDLISQFSPDELRVVERIDGTTRISPLEARQIDAINRELFSAGDLLRIEGLRPADEMADAANA